MLVKFLVMSCLLITLTKCLKGHKSLGLLLGGVLKMSLSLYLYLSIYFCHVMISRISAGLVHQQDRRISRISLNESAASAGQWMVGNISFQNMWSDEWPCDDL